MYAHLVLELWSPTKHTVTPKSFKNAIAKFNDLFGGHDQHDAQVVMRLRARFSVIVIIVIVRREK